MNTLSTLSSLTLQMPQHRSRSEGLVKRNPDLSAFLKNPDPYRTFWNRSSLKSERCSKTASFSDPYPLNHVNVKLSVCSFGWSQGELPKCQIKPSTGPLASLSFLSEKGMILKFWERSKNRISAGCLLSQQSLVTACH